ncbi:MAG: tyrosine-type recombinase/integrase [Christensenellales bacterium]|jgi:integrase/recombinase XerC
MARASENYAAQRDREYTLRTRKLMTELPPFCEEFFMGIADRTSAMTRYEYASDLRIFFKYLANVRDDEKGLSPIDYTLADLDAITLDDLERYISYVSLYEDENGNPVKNQERAKARKVSSLRSLFKYFYKKQKIANNPASLLDTPKLHEKPIIRLEANEVADLLDSVDSGASLSDREKAFHKKTRRRDVAILTLFLGTGIRVSELVGLNIDDFDFSINGFKVTRKGGNQVILYFSDEVAESLLHYIEERNAITTLPGHEKALFLSLQKKRMTVRAVENLVKKYCSSAVPLKKITPHKLRSTYGTMLYQETGDIYIVADVLGHKDVNTTKKHYAAQTDERRRQAARAVKLRED